MVGDGEAETGPLATSWHSNKFLNPITDGAVLPVLHLNGYKINNPTILARISHDELEALFRGYGYTPYFVEGSDPPSMHQAMAATLEHCVLEIRKIQEEARRTGKASRPRWPMIILRSPKGWTAPRKVDGHYLEGFWRAHQVPIADIGANPGHLQVLEHWMRSYKPEELFGKEGRLIPELRALAPKGHRRMSANPVANGGLLRKPLDMPDFRSFAVEVEKARCNSRGERPRPRQLPPRSHAAEHAELPRRSARTRRSPTSSRPSMKSPRRPGWGSISRRTRMAANCRQMAGSWRCSASTPWKDGWKGYLLSGRHGFINSYEPFIHVIDSMFNQHAKWLEKCNELPWRAKVASLNLLITGAGLATGPQRLHAPGPRDSSTWSPTRARTSCASTCRPMPTLCCRSRTIACEASTTSTSSSRTSRSICNTWTWTRRSPTARRGPASGTGPATTRAPSPMWSWRAVATCRPSRPWRPLPCSASTCPTCKVRFVNVVDLFKLVPHTEHPHGLTDREFEALFTPDRPVIFNFHGYPWLIHRLTYRRPGQHNIHVRGYKEQGNINTPLELAIRNQTDRFSLAIDAIDRMPRFRVTGSGVREALLNQQIACKSTHTSLASIRMTSTIGSGLSEERNSA